MITHLPVMVGEVLEVLNIRSGGIYVDATLGLGGHAERVLGLIGTEGRLIGIDRDRAALAQAGQRLNNGRVVLRQGRFSEIREILGEVGVDKVDGVLFDYGVSMLQLRDMGRGFSFLSEEPLDMRMDKGSGMTAEDIVNTWPERELEKIISEYGEERAARRISRAIVNHRTRQRIRTCAELARIVAGASRGRGRIHPATRTFQALRIAVNDELAEIKKGLGAAVDMLRQGGRLCAISYHSLEDRAVKQFLRNAAQEALLRIITPKPMRPSQPEMRSNPSARSAKLRGAERI